MRNKRCTQVFRIIPQKRKKRTRRETGQVAFFLRSEPEVMEASPPEEVTPSPNRPSHVSTAQRKSIFKDLLTPTDAESRYLEQMTCFSRLLGKFNKGGPKPQTRGHPASSQHPAVAVSVVFVQPLISFICAT